MLSCHFARAWALVPGSYSSWYRARDGQKIDVTVINLVNRQNNAEARILQLLVEKFKQFDGVFGSSDEVLGAIETGVDIERRFLDIVQSCRSNDQINAAFDALQAEFSFEIDTAKQNARNELLAEMDDKVIERLLGRKDSIIAHLLYCLDDLAKSRLDVHGYSATHPMTLCSAGRSLAAAAAKKKCRRRARLTFNQVTL